jgi:hypothetical protein
MNDTLTRIAPKQQEPHQHDCRHQLQRDAHPRDGNEGGCRQDAKSQPQREVQTSTISRHTPEYTEHC